jgi:hypothetical protein
MCRVPADDLCQTAHEQIGAERRIGNGILQRQAQGSAVVIRGRADGEQTDFQLAYFPHKLNNSTLCNRRQTS